jgi:hypothetical protein
MKNSQRKAQVRRPRITPAVAQIQQLVARVFGPVAVVAVIRRTPRP